jgi:hypothetical protein
MDRFLGNPPKQWPTRSEMAPAAQHWRTLVEEPDEDPDLRRLYDPYDGGADVILCTWAERDAVKERHRAWLSKHSWSLRTY